MNLSPIDQAKLEVLLRESSEVHESIGRTMATSHTLFGTVLPLAGGVLLVTISRSSQNLPLDFIACVFGAVVCLTIIFNAGLWIEASRYFRYKYLVIQPSLYQIVGENDRQSLGEFLAQDYFKRPTWHTLLFHSLAGLFSLAMTIVGIILEWTARTPFLLAVVALLAGAAAAASAKAFRHIKENMRDVASRRSESAKELPNQGPPPRREGA